MSQSITEAVKRAGLTIEQVDFLVTHQANMRLIEAIMGKVGIPGTKSFTTVQKYGNTSSGTVGTALDEAYQAGKFKPGDSTAPMNRVLALVVEAVR